MMRTSPCERGEVLRAATPRVAGDYAIHGMFEEPAPRRPMSRTRVVLFR